MVLYFTVCKCIRNCIVLYCNCICFDLRATVECFVASNAPRLTQHLFFKSLYVGPKIYPIYSNRSTYEPLEPGGAQAKSMPKFQKQLLVGQVL